VNQFDTAGMAQVLRRAGYRLVGRDQPADLVIINSCTVTHRADFEVRGLIRRARRLNPLARIVVTGCLAQTRPDELAAMPEVDLVLGQDAKADLLSLLDEPSAERTRVVQPAGQRPPAPWYFPETERTRAFFRIQDGCSASCAYCAVPKARGPSRSLPPDQVRAGLDSYYGRGYAEVVLTGIHLGAWGQDLVTVASLGHLLESLENVPGSRLRLSSIEPNEITDVIVGLAQAGGRVAPHLHLPFQSGSDRILGRMGRPYNRALLVSLVERLTGDAPDFCVGADILAGFPGEDDEAFEATRSLVASLPIAYLHVFPYSRRPGTRAAEWPNQVPEAQKKARVDELRRLGQEKKRAFIQRNLGRIRPTLIENSPDPVTGKPKGLTDNYIQVILRDDWGPQGRIAPVRLVDAGPDGRAWGEAVPE
jgi:threonylcarbamoyladenosine tRNA methylthiotransferase MtaB